MFLKVMRDIARPHWYEIMTLLKRSVGLSVAELAKALGMSYMGVKQHCIELEKRGYLDTWRRPKEIGRPEKAYRLTEKANNLFPEIGTDLTLDILATVAETSGANAVEKLLFAYFQKTGQNYLAKMKSDEMKSRIVTLARIRDYEGRISRAVTTEGSLAIVEYHDPFHLIAAVYDSVYHMEEKMIERVLGSPVTRKVEKASALTRITFHVG